MPALHKVSQDQRQQMIADAAYYRAEQRGFSGGDPIKDWLEAEAEIDARLCGSDADGLLDRLDEQLATVNGKLAALRKKVARMKADARDEYKSDIDRLAKLRGSFRKRLEEIREHGEHASENAQRRAEKVWDEISEVLKRTSARRKGAESAGAESAAASPKASGRKAAGGKPRKA